MRLEKKYIISLTNGYKVSSEILLEEIKNVLFLVVELKNGLQDILENVPQKKILQFVRQNNTLKGIKKPEERADLNKNIKTKPNMSKSVEDSDTNR